MRPLSTSSRLVLAASLVAVVVTVLVVAWPRPGVDPGQAAVSSEPSTPGGPTARPSGTSSSPSAPGQASPPGETPGASGGLVPTVGPTALPATPVPSATGAMPTPPIATPASDGDTLAGLLALLEVAPEDRSGYDRSLFAHWIDADGDGCDTRREVLIAESLTAVSVGDGCWLTGGTWTSLYDGITTTELGTFDIDHVVALAEAWDSGASGWDPDRRTRFANDLGVEWALIAVTASSNRAKSDRDPTDWLPSIRAVRCEYLSMWIAVKVRWRLAVDVAERSTLRNLVGGCDQVMNVPTAG